MLHRPLAPLAACICLLLLLAACGDDLSGVGVGVSPDGFEGGAPQAVNLTPTTFEVESINDVTGNSARILTGRVNDPAIGEMEATGYLDVSLPVTLPDGFTDGTVSSAELVLVPEGSNNNTSAPQYVYGDTTTAMTLDIYDMPAEWDATTADSKPSAGNLITTSAPFMPGDTIRIDLPDTWSGFSSLNDTTDFAESFHGFQLRAQSGNAVVGFAVVGTSSLLEVTVGEETVTYDGTRSLSAIERLTTSDLGDRVLIQDGFGSGLSFSFTIPDSLSDAPVSRASLELQTDTTLFDPAMIPDGFVRPRTDDLVLQGFTDAGDNILTNPGVLNDDGAYVFSTNTTREIFQQKVFGEPTVDRYRITLSQSSNTINPLLFYPPGTEEANAPRVSLTVTR